MTCPDQFSTTYKDKFRNFGFEAECDNRRKEREFKEKTHASLVS